MNDNTSNAEHAICSLRARLRVMLALRNGFAWATVWAFAWGSIALVARATLAVPSARLAWGLLGFVAVAIAAWMWTRRRVPDEARLRAFIDNREHCGGILMAQSSAHLAGWAVPTVALPTVSWDARRALSFFVGASAFLLLGLFLPEQWSAAAPGNALDITDEVHTLSNQVKTLAQEKIVEPARAEEWVEKLQDVKKDALAREPAKTLEALDHLQQTLKREAQRAAQVARRESEKLAKTQTLAEALRHDVLRDQPTIHQEAMRELQQMLAEANWENLLADSDLTDEQKQAALENFQKCANGDINSESLEDLVQHLSDCKNGPCNKMGRLLKAKLIPAEFLSEFLSECPGGGNREKDGEALALLLAQCNGKQSAKECINCFSLGRPGSRGISRGRGDANLSMGEETDEAGARFKEQVLPPHKLDRSNAELTGLSKTAPRSRREKSSAPAVSGALDHAKAGGGAAATRVILPRHQRAVAKYFERGQ